LKTAFEKEDVRTTIFIEDVEKMFERYNDPKQDQNIREFVRLWSEFSTNPISILVLGTFTEYPSPRILAHY